MSLYELYSKQAEARKDPTFSFHHLTNYADQLLATFQEELIHLRDFRDERVCTDANCTLIKNNLKLRVRPEIVHSFLANYKGKIPAALEDLHSVVTNLQEDEKRLVMNIRELGVIVKRFGAISSRTASE